MLKVTLMGFYNYMPSLLDGVILPEGLDNETMKNEIIRSCGDLYPVHQQPNRLKENISFWFRRNEFNFKQMIKAAFTEYNPLYNYDRIEDTLNTNAHTGGWDSESHSTVANTDARSGSDSTSGSNVRTGNDETENKTAGYNSETYVADGTSKTTYNNLTDSSLSTVTYGATNSLNGQTDNTGKMLYNENYQTDEHKTVTGNIGVKTSTAMALEEIEVRASMDVYNKIRRMFEKEFLIQVY